MMLELKCWEGLQVPEKADSVGRLLNEAFEQVVEPMLSNLHLLWIIQLRFLHWQENTGL